MAVARWDPGRDRSSPGGVAVREARSALDASCEASARAPSRYNTEPIYWVGGALLGRGAPAKPSELGLSS